MRRDIRDSQLAQKLFGGIVAEAQVSGGEFLVEDRGAQERSHLLFFDGGPRKRQGVAAARENGARNAALEGSKKSDYTFIKRKFCVATVQRDAVFGNDGVNRRGIDA